MEFSSLVLMEKEKDTQFLVRELGSYEVGEGAEHVTKLFYDGTEIQLFFDTAKDVEEWEYTAIYDLFEEEIFEKEGFSIEVIEEEYNPTWVLKFAYEEEHKIVEERIKKACTLIKEAMEKVFKEIQGKKEQYEE